MVPLNRIFTTIALLVCSNVFMTYAWYGHLKQRSTALWIAILLSWGVAFFEYCLQVPANRIGHEILSAPQLKVIQEVIAFGVFAVFSTYFLNERLTWHDKIAMLLIIAAATISLFKPRITT